MRPLHALFVVLFLVLVAGVAWRLVESGSPLAEEAAAPTGPLPATPAPAEPTRELERPDPDPDDARRSSPVEAPVAAPADEPAAARDAGPRLVGRVVDEAGAPIANARVRVVPTLFEGLVVVGGEHGELAGSRAVETDADGAFEVASVEAGTNALYVNAPGYEPLAGREIAVPAGEWHDIGEVALAPGVVLAGRVLDANGLPVGGAELAPHAETGGLRLLGWDVGVEPLATTGADGAFEIDQIADGPWALVVRSDRHPSKLVQGITDRPGEEQRGIEILLDPGAEISGRVLDAPASGRRLIVNAFPIAEDGTTGFDLADPTPFEVRRAEVDGGGRFRLRGLRIDASYRLSLAEEAGDELGPFGRSVAERVVARAGDRDVELAYRPEAALTFQVVDATSGRPLEDFEVSAGIGWTRPLMSAAGSPLRHHAEGRVRFGDLRPESARDVVRLEIEAVGYAPFERDDIRLAPASEYELGTIELRPIPVVDVTVVDDRTGAPIAGARVTLARAERGGGAEGVREVRMSIGRGAGHAPEFESAGSQVATTDAEGRCRLSSLEGETCTLTVKADGYAPRRTPEFVLPVGRVHAEEVRLDRGGSMLVTVLDAEGQPLAGEKVRHRSPTANPGMLMMGGGPSEVTDSEGRARFENLEPGLHAFALGAGDDGLMMLPGGGGGRFAMRVEAEGIEAGGDEWSEVLIGQGEAHELQLVAPLRLTLTGTILEAGVPLRGATLSLEEAGGGEADLPSLSMFGGGGPTARTNGAGEYEFANVEEGSYELVVEHPDRAMPARYELVVQSGRERFDVDLPLTIVEGTIRDPFGEPVVGVRVRARKSRGPQRQVMFIASFAGGGDATVTSGLDGPGGRVTTDAEGRYRLRGVLADVPLVIAAEGSGMQPVESEELELFEGQTKRDVDLEMVEGGELVVTVLTADGEPAEQVVVNASYIGDEFERVGSETAFTGPSGRVSFDGLVPGPWQVTANVLRPGGMDPSNVDAEGSTVVEQGGQAPIELTLP